MILIGDIGNTEIKICLFTPKFKLNKRIILKTNSVNNKYLSKKLNFLNSKSVKINKILFSSVVPNVFKKIKLFLKNKVKIRCLELKQLNLKKLIKIKVNKKQVGSDRLANAIGIIDNKFNYVILDFGTATTFDVVLKKTYQGGVIAPGIKSSLKNLVSSASLIPVVNLSKVSNIIGKNTSSAVKSGFYWGYSGLINNIIKLIRNQTQKSFKIISTGGLSNLFINSIEGKVIVKKDLTISGLLKVIKSIN